MIPKSDLLMARVKTLQQENEDLEQLCRERENQQGDSDNVNIFKEQVQTNNHKSYANLSSSA